MTPVMDFPEAWAYVRTTLSGDHHRRCSWRVTDGGLLCDCFILNKEYERRQRAQEPTADCTTPETCAVCHECQRPQPCPVHGAAAQEETP